MSRAISAFDIANSASSSAIVGAVPRLMISVMMRRRTDRARSLSSAMHTPP
ncbi:Uncharacterised protein [Mycobacteroides abscessus subsp. abscessus]|nr:Uncharacterised protein [Mycobacteroides abscessus subsp. abscessus]